MFPRHFILLVFLFEPACLCRLEGREQCGSVCGLGEGAKSNVTRIKHRKQKDGTRAALFYVPFPDKHRVCRTVLTHGSYLHGGLLYSSAVSLSLFPHGTVCCLLFLRRALCLFVPQISCLFWDKLSPHPMKSIRCLPAVLTIQPPTFLLRVSFIMFLLLTGHCLLFHVKTIDGFPSLHTVQFWLFLNEYTVFLISS